YSCSRSTLSRRHWQQTTSRAVKDSEQHKLNLQQEAELVKYIQELTTRRLPPTREMIRNFASAVAQETLSDSWVTRFLHRHNNCLLPRWASAMDSNCHYAESYTKYKQYFDILYSKIDKYNVEPENTYNMDEKGFMIGVIGRSKRVFNKRQYERKEVRQSIQASNWEWVTVLACVCADGSALPPGIIYEAAGPAIRSSWVDDIKPEQHLAHFTTSPTG
ncbi:uncharacterized protein M421DRAFT_75726, partial [Didymella exigua CBS 183.55]